MITIYDIAKELQISPSTVSRTFSNPGLVKEKTRNLVLEKAREMGYQQNMVASQLRNRSSNIIALVSLQRDWSWFTDKLANGVQDEAWAAGYEIVVLNGNSEHLEGISICEKMRFAGIIVASTELGRDSIYSNDVLPVVYVNRMIKDKNRILPDDRYGICQAMDYFKRMGHSKIGFINGPESSMHTGIRYHAFLDKMKEFRFTVNPRWIKKGDWTFRSAYECTKELLKEEQLPTALMAANDQMCIGVYQALREKGFVPGEDISIIGHDDIEYSQMMYPALTTISIPLYEMGRLAGKMLLDQIKGEKEGKENVVKGQLIIRDSVKKLSGERAVKK